MSRPKPNKSSDLKKKNELNLETKTGPDRSNLVSFLIKLLAQNQSYSEKEEETEILCLLVCSQRPQSVTEAGLGQAQGSSGALAPSH